MSNLNVFGVTQMSELNERVARTEATVEHIQGDVRDIKADVGKMSEAMSTLATIAQQNQSMGPRLEKVESEQAKIKTRLAGYAGAFAVLLWIASNWDKVKGLL